MTMFRDARSKWDLRFRSDAPLKPNPYYQEMLKGTPDEEFVKGFDWALDEVANCILYNLEVVSDELENDSEIDLLKVLQNNAEKVNNAIKKYTEMERDVLITSMIDNMDEEEYEKKFKEIWGCTPEEAENKEWKEDENI